MPKPTWGNIALHYFIGSLAFLDAMWLVQLHDYVFASVAALAVGRRHFDGSKGTD